VIFDYWTVGAASAFMGVVAPLTARDNVNDFIDWVGLKNTPGLQAAESAGFAVTALAYAYGGAKAEQPINSVGSTMPVRYVYVNEDGSPISAANLNAANGMGLNLYYNPLGAAQNRADALRGLPKVSGYDLDEAPPAVLRQPGDPVIITPTPRSDNRAAGQRIGTQLQGTMPGQRIIIIVVPTRGPNG